MMTLATGNDHVAGDHDDQELGMVMMLTIAGNDGLSTDDQW